jgi:hypothetical protein
MDKRIARLMNDGDLSRLVSGSVVEFDNSYSGTVLMVYEGKLDDGSLLFIKRSAENSQYVLSFVFKPSDLYYDGTGQVSTTKSGIRITAKNKVYGADYEHKLSLLGKAGQ